MVTRLSFSTQWMLGCVTLILLLAFFTREVMSAHSIILTADVWFENLLLSIRTPFLLHVFNWITFFGEILVVIGIAGLISIAILLLKLDKTYIAGLAVALIGAAASSYIMKAVIERARPDGLIPAVTESSFSFPSGHATLAVALYGFTAFFLCKMYPRNTKLIVVVATVIVLAIGFSRLYLGVHFPSDVIAGYILGGLWVLIGIEIAKRFRRAAP